MWAHWVCSASAVTTTPVMSMVDSKGWKQVIVGLSVYFSLSHHESTVMSHRGQQVHTTLPGVITGATQRLAVHRDRRCATVLAGQPRTDRAIQGITIDQSQHGRPCATWFCGR